MNKILLKKVYFLMILLYNINKNTLMIFLIRKYNLVVKDVKRIVFKMFNIINNHYFKGIKILKVWINGNKIFLSMVNCKMFGFQLEQLENMNMKKQLRI